MKNFVIFFCALTLAFILGCSQEQVFLNENKNINIIKENEKFNLKTEKQDLEYVRIVADLKDFWTFIDDKITENYKEKIFGIVYFTNMLELGKISSMSWINTKICAFNIYYLDDYDIPHLKLFVMENNKFVEKIKASVSGIHVQSNGLLYDKFIYPQFEDRNQVIFFLDEKLINNKIKWSFDPILNYYHNSSNKLEIRTGECGVCDDYKDYIACDIVTKICGRGTFDEGCSYEELVSQNTSESFKSNNFSLLPTTDIFNIGLYYDFRDKFLKANDKGKKFISLYYDYGKVSKSEKALSASTLYEIIKALPKINEKVKVLMKSDSDNIILFHEQEISELNNILIDVEKNTKGQNAKKALNELKNIMKEVEDKSIKEIFMGIKNNSKSIKIKVKSINITSMSI